jgi:thioredoxin reductase
MAAFHAQAVHQGAELVTADVQKVAFSSRPFTVWVGGDENVLYVARSVIIATGARANYIGLDSEQVIGVCPIATKRAPASTIRVSPETWLTGFIVRP